MVHFPIALLIAGAVAEGLGKRQRAEWLSQARRFCVLAAAAGALLAAPLGWFAAETRDVSADEATILERHRWVGVTTALWLSLTAVLSERTARSGWTRGRAAFRLFLFSGVLLVSMQGHLGATLTHGRGYATL